MFSTHLWQWIEIFNKCLLLNRIWKRRNIICFIIILAKVRNPTTPFFSKIIESWVLQQLSSHLFQNNLLNLFQSGFRQAPSTTTALLKVTEDIREGMDSSKDTLLVLIDFPNAITTVDYNLLLAVLSQLKVSTPALEWFWSYLRGCQQSIKTQH